MNALQIYLNQGRGRAVRLANTLGISPGAISQWDRVPAERVAEVEKVTGIPRDLLRPDIFGVESPGTARPKNTMGRKQKRGEAVVENAKPKSIVGCLKGMATLPPDFNPAEPFWTEKDDWENSSIGGIESK
jgi:DNA-binding transcriptional regulator YdaS (Cro superfamily)